MTKLIDLRGKLRVGQKVREVRSGLAGGCSNLQNGQEATVTFADNDRVEFDGCSHHWGADIELLGSFAPSWETLSVGYEIKNRDGFKSKVLAVLGSVFLKSQWDEDSTNWDTTTNNWFHIEEVKRNDWTVVDDAPFEVVTVNGKKYKADEVRDRITELKPVE